MSPTLCQEIKQTTMSAPYHSDLIIDMCSSTVTRATRGTRCNLSSRAMPGSKPHFLSPRLGHPLWAFFGSLAFIRPCNPMLCISKCIRDNHKMESAIWKDRDTLSFFQLYAIFAIRIIIPPRISVP